MFKLNKGDKIGIISPSSCLENKDISPAINFLKKFGLIPVLGKYVNSSYHYMGGTDPQRAEDIMAFFKDTSIKAIFCTRGGAGSLKVLTHLDYDIIRHNPKPIFGFSDSTVLQNGIYNITKNISYSGFLLAYDSIQGEVNNLQQQDLLDIFQGKEQNINSGQTVINGETKGILIGGNISALNSLCGTPYFPDLRNKILLIEDTGIKSYQLDIMLNQLKMQKNFDKLKGIIFGEFSNIRIVDECDGNIDDNISYFCQGLTIPVIKNFAYGHVPARHILPIGKNIHLNANKCCIKI